MSRMNRKKTHTHTTHYCMFWCPYMVSVQCDGGLPPDIILLTLCDSIGEPFECHEEFLSLQPPPVLSTCPLHTNSGCGKERRILIGPWGSAKAAPVRNYLEVYWPCAGGLSAVNAIGTQLRDPINSGLTRWRMAVS